jgi:UDP-hydrolysing UDP-N-acetyl-D-glucosamine 2-epimerase
VRICIVITARPSYSRVKTVLENLKDNCHLQIVAAASALVNKYGDVAQQIEADGFTITRRLPCLVETNDPSGMALTTSVALHSLTNVSLDLKPDRVVTIADRYETLATAIAASYMNIPLVHLQGGERTGSIDDKVRFAVSQLADIHCCATEKAASVLVDTNAGGWAIHTGCPSIDLARRAMGSLKFEIFEEYGGVGPTWEFEARQYAIVLQHPVTDTYKDVGFQIAETIKAVEEFGMPTFWFWPNPDSGSGKASQELRKWREVGPKIPVHFFRNLSPEHFLNFMFNCAVIVGNSSVAIREGSYMGTPAVNIGNRQKGRERGENVVDAPYDAAKILRAMGYAMGRERNMSGLYGDGQSGPRIARLILGGNS